MDIAFAVILFLFGLGFVLFGGDFLVSSALRLCNVTGWGKALVGATIVAVSTVTPELFISVFAAWEGNHGIAVGNAIGGMIANVALVLGLYMVVAGGKIETKEILPRSIFMIGAFVLLFYFSYNKVIALYGSVILIALFLVYLAFSIKSTKVHAPSAKKSPNLRKVNTHPPYKKEIILVVLSILLGQVFLMGGAFLLVQNGGRIGDLTGVNQTVIGFTIIAIATAMPELVTVMSSVRKKSGEMALGNLLGTCIINATLLFGLSGIVATAVGSPLRISSQTLWISFPVLIGVSLVAIIPMLKNGKTNKWQGYLLVTTYAIYLGFIFFFKTG